MHDEMMHGWPMFWFGMWLIPALVIGVVIVLVVYFLRPRQNRSLLVADLAALQPGPLASFADASPAERSQRQRDAHDTIFILPDISNYTQYMARNRFAFAHAQHVVFSLINAMIEAACKTVELSKLEGDAALFFADAQRHSEAEIGQTIMNIFAAFFRQRRRLLEANLCPCEACTHIEQLDLKIFVHRGQATRFEFKGATDHFGADVIVLHRLMKNSLRGHRYAMVTDAASGCVELPGDLAVSDVEEEHDHLGKVHAQVFELSDQQVEQLCQEPSPPISRLKEFVEKLRMNAGDILSALSH